jgi:hypothetical protein
VGAEAELRTLVKAVGGLMLFFPSLAPYKILLKEVPPESST